MNRQRPGIQHNLYFEGPNTILGESGYHGKNLAIETCQLPRKNFLFHVIPTNRAKTICRYQNSTSRILSQPTAWQAGLARTASTAGDCFRMSALSSATKMNLLIKRNSILRCSVT